MIDKLVEKLRIVHVKNRDWLDDDHLLINFRKRAAQMAIISDSTTWQSKRFNFLPVYQISTLLQTEHLNKIAGITLD